MPEALRLRLRAVFAATLGGDCDDTLGCAGQALKRGDGSSGRQLPFCCPAQRLASAGALAVTLMLAGCSTPAPPPLLLQLRAAPPVAVQPVATQQVLQLMAPLALPEALDRSALLLPEGAAGLQAVPGVRWAEPLRDALPRLLRQDLALLLGAARVWAAPVPPGAGVTRQLRVELLHLHPRADRTAVELQARWTLVDPQGRQPPQVGGAQVLAPSTGPGADALAAAHRLALWRLAEQIAAAL